MKARCARSEDNILVDLVAEEERRKSWLQSLTSVFYDNPFFNKLFPLIAQQKPGKDLYVFIATI